MPRADGFARRRTDFREVVHDDQDAPLAEEVVEQFFRERRGPADQGLQLAAHRLGEGQERRFSLGGLEVQLVLDQHRQHEVFAEALGAVSGQGPAAQLAGQRRLARAALAPDEQAAPLPAERLPQLSAPESGATWPSRTTGTGTYTERSLTVRRAW